MVRDITCRLTVTSAGKVGSSLGGNVQIRLVHYAESARSARINIYKIGKSREKIIEVTTI